MLAIVIGLALSAAQAPAPPPPARPATRGVRITEAQPDPDPAPAPIAPPPRETPVALVACQHLKPDLTVEVAGFDPSLRRLLASGVASVVVDAPDFRPEAAPPRLAGWLGEVQRTGGAVNRQDIPCGRTRGFSLLKLLGKLFTSHSEPLYLPAKDYDATLWTDKASGLVKQVQFIHRPS